MSGRDSGVRAAGTLFSPLQHWGGVGTDTVLPTVGTAALRKLAELPMAPEVMGLF